MTLTLSGLEGRVAVVTGAGRMRSIGRSVCLELARAGCDLVVTGTGRDPRSFPEDERAVGWRDVESACEEVRALGGTALPVVADVSTQQGVVRVLDAADEGFGGVDFLVNNAAAGRGGDRVPVVDLDPAVWDRVIAVNLGGTFAMSREFARRRLAAGRGGAIVNVSSIGGKLAGAGTAAYSASKAGVQALTSSMAKELGPHGIRVNAVCPGVTETSRLDDLSPQEWQAYVEANLPLRRAGAPEEVAALIAFLLSEQSGWVTGQSWNIDGGQLTIR
ncbi:MAG: SDR family oxidoreductase [Nocardioides sp.]|uniref:SDR family NAD(P)-dependent oxidoreductase n=1 Tax=Nocardioides sp. TaxID=35761 RepID=UPI0039E375C3